MRRGERSSAASYPTFTPSNNAESFRDRASAGKLVRVYFGCELPRLVGLQCYPEVQETLLLGEAEGEA